MSDSNLIGFFSRRGHTFLTFTMESKIVLPVLYEKLKAQGVRLIKRRVGDLDNLKSSGGYDLVINCCGSGAKELLCDDSIEPVSGQILRVKAPYVHQGLASTANGGAYILPKYVYLFHHQHIVVHVHSIQLYKSSSKVKIA